MEHAVKQQQLLAFVYAARLGSLRAAARQLGLTQPAVTHTIRELESSLDVELVTRTNRGIELTEAGDALLPRAEQLLADMRRVRETIEQVKNRPVGNVSVGTLSTIALTILPDAVLKFREMMPLVKLRIHELSVVETLARLRNGDLDIAVTHRAPELDSDFEHDLLFTCRFAIAMRAGHPLAKSTRLTELLDAEWIATLTSEGLSQSVMKAMFEAQGLPFPRRMLDAPSSFAVRAGLLAKTDVIGCYTRPLVRSMIPLGITMAPIQDELPELDFAIISRRDLAPTPAVLRFSECLRQAAREQADSLQ
ncbi:LysR family transcriptional regulator [Burkholderia sp. SJ98]|nr:LysR family transcriptional regulator [Burkholderia sp. SJ98]